VPSTGRKPKPIDPDAPPPAAVFGRTLRERRLTEGFTQTTLGQRAGCSAQHISGLELAKVCPTQRCAAAIDAALSAEGALLKLLPAAVCERVLAARARAEGRSATLDGVGPIDRRTLLEAGAAAALPAALTLGSSAAPTQAREVDPALPGHWTRLLNLLGRHDELVGPVRC